MTVNINLIFIKNLVYTWIKEQMHFHIGRQYSILNHI